MPPNGLKAMQDKRAARSRSDQRLPPKRQNPGAGTATGDPATQVDADTRYTVAPLDTLAHNPRNARDNYDETEIDEMADSLREFGQLQPIVVISRSVWLAHLPDDAEQIGNATYVVDIGNRRLAAARKAGLAQLDVDVRDDLGSGEEHGFDEAMIIENSHRKDLDPLLEAKALERMTNKPGSSLRKVAKQIGRSHGYIHQRLTLLGLIPELRGALNTVDEDGETLLGFRQARILGTLSAEQQREVWAAGPPFATPVDQADEDTEQPSTPGAVNQVSSPKPQSAGIRRVTLPKNDPLKLVSVLREHLTEDELAEVLRLLLSPDVDEAATSN